MKLNIKNTANIFKRFNFLRKNSSYLFMALFFGLLIWEGFVLNDVAAKVLHWEDQIPAINPAKGVRINFDNYKNVVDRIQHADNYQPQNLNGNNPFYLKPDPTPGSSTSTTASTTP